VWQPMKMQIHLYVDDCDAVYERAVRAGAQTVEPPADKPYGERNAWVSDPFGNQWFIATPN
jgi:PhnB protein